MSGILVNKCVYSVCKNDKFGRYLVADRNLKQGELILKESPLIVGAPLNAVLICFNCCRKLSSNIQICMKCRKATLCSKNCTGKFHHTEECNALKETKVAPQNFIEYPQIVTPLRCLLVRQYNPDLWTEFMKLEPHLIERRNTWIWRMHQLNVEKVLHQELGVLTESDVAEEIIQKICGILDVNSFELRSVERTRDFIQGLDGMNDLLRGVYLEAALMAHDCLGNTHLAVDDDFFLVVRAGRNIAKGETIFFNYTNALLGSVERRNHLKEGKYFDCNCKRCTDPTEMGTEMSSLVCSKCRAPSLMPNNTENNWKCAECSKTYCNSLISRTVDEARQRIENLGTVNAETGEKLLDTFLLTFNRNHYVIIELKQALISCYGRKTTEKPTEKDLRRIIVLCKELIDILKTVEPGISRLQAVTFYELQKAQIQLSLILCENKEAPKEEFVENLLKGETYLKESIKYLLYEPPNSPEGRLAQRAMLELKELRGFVTRMSLGTNNSNSKKNQQKMAKNQKKNNTK